jgi:nicotinamide-nucleotide amidase
VRAEVLAIGTELLLGQVVDTNSAAIGELLAQAGIDCLYQTRVGDNRGRIVDALRGCLARSDAVICCGGLGPTQDDITREAIAEVMGVPLERNPEIEQRIRDLFASRGREMARNNLRQADVPRGAWAIDQVAGTAPGLICPVGDRVIYAVPGVPHEMAEMMARAVLPDLRERSGDRAVIMSRTLRTWGLAESTVAERVAGRLEALEPAGNPTIAFLASGIEGIKVRITAKAAASDAPDGDAAAVAERMLDAEERELRSLLGPVVFGVDGATMESAVGELLVSRQATLGVAESLTGGLIAARLTAVAGASSWFRGGVVSYDSGVKHRVLGVAAPRVVTPEAAREMASGVARLLDATVGLAVTGVAGPTEQEDQPVGTVWVGLSIDGVDDAVGLQVPGDRDRVRQMTVISALDLLRRRLLGGAG